MNVIPFLDKLQRTFPKDAHEDIYVLYLFWDDTVRLALEVDPTNTAVAELIPEFWNLFDVDGPMQQDELWNRIEHIREPLLLTLNLEQLSPDEEKMLNDLNEVAYEAAVERPSTKQEVTDRQNRKPVP